MKNIATFAIFVIFLLSGCSFFDPKPKQEIKKPTPVNKTAIKGVITELSYQDGGYCYTIVSTDTTNAKLPKASFCSPKFYNNKGDLVYATFLGQKVESMLLIREANELVSVKKSRKNIKTKIDIPKSESISFD